MNRPREGKGGSGVDHDEQGVRQNLEDAGCDCDTVERYCALGCGPEVDRTTCKEQIRLLQKHRREVLNDLHSCQSRLDCLDYLLYNLREKQKDCCADTPCAQKEPTKDAGGKSEP